MLLPINSHLFHVPCLDATDDFAASGVGRVTEFRDVVLHNWFKQNVFVHRSHNLNKQQVQETQKQYAYLKIYSCIVLINSTNNRYRKNKSNMLILKCIRAGYS